MTAVLRVLEISVGVILFHSHVGEMKRARGLEGVALLALGWRTRQSMEYLGHRSGSPEDLWLILFPLIHSYGM